METTEPIKIPRVIKPRLFRKMAKANGLQISKRYIAALNRLVYQINLAAIMKIKTSHSIRLDTKHLP